MHKTMVCLAALLVTGLAGCVQDTESTAVICTNFGPISVELYTDETPAHARNFIELAKDGYYDGVTFHRIITDFMMQGGDPQGTGGGGRTADGNPLPDETRDDIKHDRPGLLSMANRGSDPTTGTSQFFITFVPTPHLDGKHAVFGEVTEGMDVVERVNAEASSRSGTPAADVHMITVLVGGTPDACPEPPAPEPAHIEADAITPGTWSVSHTDLDSLFVWAENTGDESADIAWQMTGADGAALPPGWNVTFDDATQTVRGGAAVYTMARIEVPADAAGDMELQLHTGMSTTPITVSVGLDPARVAREGDAVNVEYAGRCTANDQPFDDGEFPLTLGGGRAIVGFDLGLVGMSEGEPQEIVLPAAHAYGNSGPCGSLDPADLTFEVKILSFS